MNNDILLLRLKRMRYKVKLASDVTIPSPSDEDEIEVIEAEPGPDEVFVSEDDPDEDSPLNWRGEVTVPGEWDETPTKITVDPAKIRENVKKFYSVAGRDPAKIDQMTDEEVKSLWHMAEFEKSKGMVPHSGGMMTEEARQKGLEKTRRDRPEMFDPTRQKMMSGWKNTYFRYNEPVFYGDRTTQLKEMMEASRGYVPTRLNEEISAELSGILNELVGKVFTISTGSPTIPKEERVKIVDVDTEDQRIIFQSAEDPRFKYFSSYDDFFYHKKWSGKSDAEMALERLVPGAVIPNKDGFLSKGLKSLLRVFRPGAKA
jgi:hypothetical protein